MLDRAIDIASILFIIGALLILINFEAFGMIVVWAELIIIILLGIWCVVEGD